MIDLNNIETCAFCISSKLLMLDSLMKAGIIELQCTICNCIFSIRDGKIFIIKNIFINGIHYVVNYYYKQIFISNPGFIYPIIKSIPNFDSYQELVDNINILTLFK